MKRVVCGGGIFEVR